MRLYQHIQTLDNIDVGVGIRIHMGTDTGVGVHPHPHIHTDPKIHRIGIMLILQGVTNRVVLALVARVELRVRVIIVGLGVRGMVLRGVLKIGIVGRWLACAGTETLPVTNQIAIGVGVH